MARPSATAVLPTPGSPIRTGLFFVRLARICITRSISLSLPTTGSNLSSCAAKVKSLPNSSRLGVLVFPLEEELELEEPEELEEEEEDDDEVGFDSPNILTTLLLTLFKSTPRFSNTLAATPSPSLIKPRSRCSVPI